jgi:hypothetical protein
VGPDPDIYLMRIRMWMQVTKMIWIHADPDPQHCILYSVYPHAGYIRLPPIPSEGRVGDSVADPGCFSRIQDSGSNFFQPGSLIQGPGLTSIINLKN